MTFVFLFIGNVKDTGDFVLKYCKRWVDVFMQNEA
jgi:hypothetical protein